MDIVIFCGGRGSRLSEKTKEVPKPLVEVGNRPIMWHIMKIMSHYGHNRFILTLGYKGDLIKHWFLDYRLNESFEFDFNNPLLPKHKENWKILFKNTGIDSGTGFRLKQIEKDVKSDQFIVVYGDCLADVDIKKLVEYHNKMVKEHGILATITGFQPNSRFGLINLNDSGIITSFTEKPKMKEWVNIGFMVCEKCIFAYLSDKPSAMFEVETLNNLAKEKKLALYKHEGIFHPMDTYKDYVELNSIWKSGEAKWKLWKD